MVGTLIQKLIDRSKQVEVKIAIKTALAASISFILGVAFNNLFHRPDVIASGVWSTMAAIVVIQARLEVTNKAALDRFLGVFVGCVAGSFFLHYLGSSALSIGISVFGTIALCSLFDIKDSFRIASMSTAFIVIMGGVKTDVDPWVFGYFRFLDSCIGIIVAVVIAFMIWPQTSAAKLKTNVIKSLGLMGKYYRLSTIINHEKEIHGSSVDRLSKDIKKIIVENRKLSDEMEADVFLTGGVNEKYIKIANNLDNIFDSIATVNDIDKETLGKIIDDSLANTLANIIDKTDVSFQNIAKKLEGEVVENNHDLNDALEALKNDLVRFRETRKMRQYNLDDVESFYAYFYNIKTIGQSLEKLET